jgi:hypothetical protein
MERTRVKRNGGRSTLHTIIAPGAEKSTMIKLTTGEPARIKKSTMLMVILVLVLAYAVLHSIIPKVSAESEPIYIEHVVEPGETLYSISTRYRSDQDWRKTSYEIQKASDCTALIRPGQVLLVPVVE